MLTKVCHYCKKVYQTPSRKKISLFCSRECSSKSKIKHGIFICKNCGKEFRKKHYKNRGMYCSRKCSAIGRRKSGGKRIIIKCSYCGKESERWVSNLQHPVSKRAKKYFFCNMGCVSNWKKGKESLFKGVRRSEETKKKLRAYRGEKTSNWKGGISFEKYYGTWQAEKRRSLKVANGGSYEIYEWENLKRKFRYTCPSCGKKEPEIKLTTDHIVPLSVGGRNSIDNIQPLCKKCNSSKGTKTIKLNRMRQQEMVF